MNKIICDICGTIYPDSAPICPICGYPRENSKTVAETADAEREAKRESSGYAPVKGGRFSNKNVKKRHQAETPSEPRRNRQPEPKPEKDEEQVDRSLIVTAVVLVIALLLVSVYIGWRFWKGRNAYDKPADPVASTPAASDTTPVDTEPVPTDVPCVGLTISDSSVVFVEAGKGWLLDITRNPADTTDELVITSSDENVVSVTQEGLLTAVGPGSATITITCGSVVRECQVSCTFTAETEPPATTQPVETTEPEETTKPTEPTKPNQEGLVISHSDVTMFNPGENFRITVKYNGETVSAAQVSFSTKDAAVATVDANGKVIAVGGGTTTIIVSYNGETEKCVVRCKIEEEATEDTEPDESGWTISHSDVTLRVGESFTLRLRNAAGETADVAWSVSESGVVDVSGNKITGLTGGSVRISATIDGQTYTCIVRVKA